MVSVNQVNSNHVDTSGRGFYDYAPAKIGVIKMNKFTETDGVLVIDESVFIDGANF